MNKFDEYLIDNASGIDCYSSDLYLVIFMCIDNKVPYTIKYGFTVKNIFIQLVIVPKNIVYINEQDSKILSNDKVAKKCFKMHQMK